MITGKKYIGKRKFNNDWKYYIVSGKILKLAIKKYGRCNFNRNIISIGYSDAELNILEIYFIKIYDAVNSDNFYNMASGGEGGRSSFVGKTKEEMHAIGNKISKSRIGKYTGKRTTTYNLGKNHPMYGKHHTEESKIKMKEARLNKYTGENNPNYGNHKLAGSNNPKSKKIICITTNEVFNFIMLASEKYNISYSNISHCCKGKQKSAGKHPETGEKLVWMYYDEWLKEQSKESIT